MPEGGRPTWAERLREVRDVRRTGAAGNPVPNHRERRTAPYWGACRERWKEEAEKCREAAQAAEEEARAACEKAKRDAALYAPPPPVNGDELRHAKFGRVRALVELGLPTFLVGPAGSGKTHLAEQVARDLGRESVLDSLSGGRGEGHLLRKHTMTGPEEGLFLRAYRDGLVWIGDEIEKGDPNALTVLNGALANGYIDLPGVGRVNRHPDFVAVVIGNTYGTGGDRVYCGSNQLDGSTLNRFQAQTVHVGYSAALEERLIAPEVLAWGRAVRKGMNAKGMRRILSTRDLLNATKQVRSGIAFEEVKASIFSGWKVDEVRLVDPDFEKPEEE